MSPVYLSYLGLATNSRSSSVAIGIWLIKILIRRQMTSCFSAVPTSVDSTDPTYTEVEEGGGNTFQLKENEAYATRAA